MLGAAITLRAKICGTMPEAEKARLALGTD